MPFDAPRVRAALCENDRETLYRWIDGGAPYQ